MQNGTRRRPLGRAAAGAVAGAIIASVGACAEERAARMNTGATVDALPNGTVHVVNDGTGLWTPGQAWALEEELRLGTVDEGGPEQFSQVAWVLEHAGGRIWVLDYPSQQIRIFEADGTHVRTIGGRGDGPGELSNAAGLDLSPDGNVWVWGSRRFSVFDAAGDFVTSYPRLTGGVIYPWMGGFLDDGRYFDWGLEFEPGGTGRPDAIGATTWMHAIHFTPPGTYDTLGSVESVSRMSEAGSRLIGAGRRAVLDLTGDGTLWTALTDQYRLVRRTIDGDTLRIVDMPTRPDYIPDAEIDSLIESARAAGSPRDYAREDFERERRLVTRVRLDHAGHIWVFPGEEGVPEGTVADIFREDGTHLGRIELPERILVAGPPPTITAEHLYAVLADAFDVPYVVRWRIVRP